MRPARVIVAHGIVPEDAPPDERDVLTEVETVVTALQRAGHEVDTLAVEPCLEAAARRLGAAAPDVVFNLVETLGGKGELIAVFPSLLEHLRLPYSGCPADALLLTSNKLTAKAMMRAAGVPTAEWLTAEVAAAVDCIDGPFIVKSAWEHASIGLGAGSVVSTAEELRAAISSLQTMVGGAVFCEQFVDGRELNISILETDEGPQCLPPAEIVFDGWPAGRPKIVDYQAKWDEGSPEYRSTVRSFDFTDEDRLVLSRTTEIALRCWDLFGLRGAARVDVRLDGAGMPWVLEVNANPCLSPDGGLMAAAERAGLVPDHVVAGLLAHAVENGRKLHAVEKVAHAG